MRFAQAGCQFRKRKMGLRRNHSDEICVSRPSITHAEDGASSNLLELCDDKIVDEALVRHAHDRVHEDQGRTSEDPRAEVEEDANV